MDNPYQKVVDIFNSVDLSRNSFHFCGQIVRNSEGCIKFYSCDEINKAFRQIEALRNEWEDGHGNLEEESEKQAKSAEDCTETADDDGGFN